MTANQKKGNTENSSKARENTGDQVLICFIFACDWLKEWPEFSGPIKEQRKAKTNQSRVTFDTQLKFALYDYRLWSLKTWVRLYSPEKNWLRWQFVAFRWPEQKSSSESNVELFVTFMSDRDFWVQHKLTDLLVYWYALSFFELFCFAFWDLQPMTPRQNWPISFRKSDSYVLLTNNVSREIDDGFPKGCWNISHLPPTTVL